MRKATFLTLVHNGERFVEETIKSVLNQSEKDFWYFIRLNACTDGSERIVQKYAKKDKRIVVLKNEVNYVTDDGFTKEDREFWPDFDSEYVAHLDHDDILEPDFLKILYAAGKKNDADLVVGGCYFFEDQTRKVKGARVPPQIKCQSLEELSPYFSELYGSLRTTWGKLYRAELYHTYYEQIRKFPEKLKLCGDTWLILSLLEHCQCVVAVEKPLLYYRVNQVSQFHAKKPELSRIYEGKILFDKAMSFLEYAHCKTNENISCLYSVHAGHMADLIKIVQNSTAMSNIEKIEYIQYILEDNHLYTYRAHALSWLQLEIQTCMDSILENTEDDITLWQYYLYRLWYVKQAKQYNKDIFCIYISALADKRNKLFYGLEWFSEYDWDTVPLRESNWFSSLDETEKLKQLQQYGIVQSMCHHTAQTQWELEQEQHIIQCMETDEWVQAFDHLQNLERMTVVSETGLFCRLMILLIQGNMEQAQKFLYIAKNIVPESGAIDNIYQQFICTERCGMQ